MILIVDDDATLGNALERFFRSHNLSAISVTDPLQALASVHVILPSLIILDIKMPGLGGLELLGRIRADKTYRSVPIMIYTVDFSQQSEEAAINGGAQAYIIKGTVPLEDVLARAKELIADKTIAM